MSVRAEKINTQISKINPFVGDTEFDRRARRQDFVCNAILGSMVKCAAVLINEISNQIAACSV